MGLFNGYLKEGKGVEKDTREKKGFFKFFEHFSHHSWKLLIAGIVTNLLSLPIVTFGIAEVGMSRIARSASLDRPIFITSDYLDSIKKNWKQATAVAIIDGLIICCMALSLFIAWAISKVLVFGLALFVILCVGAFVFWCSTHYHYTLLMTCNLKLGQIYKNSFKLVALGLKSNLIIALSLGAIYGLMIAVYSLGNITALAIMVLIFTLVYRMLSSYIIQFNTFPVVRKYILDPYYEQHPDEDKEIRHDLGMYDMFEELEGITE